jgi:hypothetical protein
MMSWSPNTFWCLDDCLKVRGIQDSGVHWITRGSPAGEWVLASWVATQVASQQGICPVLCGVENRGNPQASEQFRGKKI